jgi:hypothetical protein
MRTAILALLLALAACSGTPQHPDDPTGGTVLRFKGAPADGELWLDGVFIDNGLKNGVRIAPGAHQIEIRHDRYHTWYGELTLKEGEQRTLAVELAEILP